MSDTAPAPMPLPSTGFVRLAQILGDPDGDPPIPGVIPIRKSAWWQGVKTGKYPVPIKLGRNTTAWRAEDIHALITRLSAQPAADSLGTQLTHARQAKRRRSENSPGAKSKKKRRGVAEKMKRATSRRSRPAR